MEDLRQDFLTMDVHQRQRFLTIYAHELTVLARVHLADGEWEAARQCNESLHRITGYLASSARSPEATVDVSFILMIVNVARERGWGQILRESHTRSSQSEA